MQPRSRSATTGAPLVDREAHAAFLTWLADPELPEELHLRGSDHPSTPVLWVLGQLAASGGVLPRGVAATLGLPSLATVGHAATELVLAVNDPAGPRCATYRAAVIHLRTRGSCADASGVAGPGRSPMQG
jgi:hypothetical protein